MLTFGEIDIMKTYVFARQYQYPNMLIERGDCEIEIVNKKSIIERKSKLIVRRIKS